MIFLKEKVRIDTLHFMNNLYCVVPKQYWAVFVFNEKEEVEQDDARTYDDGDNYCKSSVERFCHFHF